MIPKIDDKTLRLLSLLLRDFNPVLQTVESPLGSGGKIWRLDLPLAHDADYFFRVWEYLSFLREIEKNVPKNLEVHIIVDNYATHKHLRVRRWLATRPRFHMHFTPTYSSWLNQVEIWFNRITQQAIRRGTFRSVKELVEKIDNYVQNANRQARPFVWTATADSVIAKVERLCIGISGTAH